MKNSWLSLLIPYSKSLTRDNYLVVGLGSLNTKKQSFSLKEVSKYIKITIRGFERLKTDRMKTFPIEDPL